MMSTARTARSILILGIARTNRLMLRGKSVRCLSECSRQTRSITDWGRGPRPLYCHGYYIRPQVWTSSFFNLNGIHFTRLYSVHLCYSSRNSLLQACDQTPHRHILDSYQNVAMSTSASSWHQGMPRDCPGNVGCCLEATQHVFTLNQVSEPQNSAELIIAQALGYKTLHGVSRSVDVPQEAWDAILNMASKRITHQPLQYVLGEWDFMDLTLVMRPPVFIPRPETEELVMLARSDPVLKSARRFLEVGSGSGAISLSLLKGNDQLEGVVVEQGAEAYALTQTNAKHVGVESRLAVHHANFHANMDVDRILADGKFDVLISNPPYLTPEDMQQLPIEIKNFEDEKAFRAGPDGLDVIRDILRLAPRLLRDGGSLWLEVYISHPPLIAQLIDSDPQLEYVSTYEDFNHLCRFCHITFHEK